MKFRQCFFTVSRQSSRCGLFVVILVSSPFVAWGQSILDDQLEVAAELQPLDQRIRDQLAKLFDAREAAFARYGESAEYFDASDQHNPLRMLGAPIV